MTYLIIGNNNSNIEERITSLLSQLWQREIEEDIFNFTSPDLHKIETSNIKSIGIDDVKKLQKEMVYTPYSEEVQVAIIFNAEKLTIQAQNSFLKTLEDSSSTTAYILTTTNEKKLLPTILSRAMKIYTKQIREKNSTNDIPEILQKNLVDAFIDLEKISKDNDKTTTLLDNLESYYQAILEQKLESNEQSKEIYDNIQKISKTRRRIEANGNKRLLLENLFLVLTS